MRLDHVAAILFLTCFTACTTVIMKRCPEKVLDEDIMECPEVVQGPYRDCQKPKNLYRCTDPQ